MLRKLWNRFGPRAATMTSRSRVDYRTRLSLEPLEQRRMLSVKAVFDTTIDDDNLELSGAGGSGDITYVSGGAWVGLKEWTFTRSPLNTEVYALSA